MIGVYEVLKKKLPRWKLYLPRQKWTINQTLIFLKVVPLVFNTLIPVNIQLVKAFESFLFIGYEIVPFFFFFFSPHPQILFWTFQFRKQEKKLQSVRGSCEYGGCCTWTILCFTQNCWSKNIDNWHLCRQHHWII